MKQIAGLWLLAGVVLPFATHAQTNVTLYGVISTAVRYTSNIDGEHGSLSQLVSSGIGGSRWGLKGSEDLGNGNQTIFVLENGFGTNDGKTAYNALFGRQAYVGVSGAWGSLTLGRQYNALNNIGWAYNPLDQSWGNFWSDPLYTGGDVFFQDYRINNSVVYSRTTGPLTLQADYGFGQQAGSTSRGSTFGGGLMYQQGPLSVGVAYDQHRARTGDNTLHNYSIGGSYAVGKATAYLGHMGRRETAQHPRYAISFIGLGYQLTPALHVSGAYYRYQQRGKVTTQYQPVPVLLGSGNGDIVAAVADYALSPRTSVFLELDATRARGGAVGRETEYWSGQAATGVGSTTRIGVMTGMRHMF